MKTKMKITDSKVGTFCPDCGRAGGAMFSVPVSRIEESLGHQVYECDKCHARYKSISNQE
jgi:hypothetical protein